MGISFILLVNKQGQTRLANYTDSSIEVGDRKALEGEIVRRCLARSEKQASIKLAPALTFCPPPRRPRRHSDTFLLCSPQCSFIEHRNYKVIYRRYASLFFLVGVDGEEVHNLSKLRYGGHMLPSVNAPSFSCHATTSRCRTGLQLARLSNCMPQRMDSVQQNIRKPAALVQNELAILEFIHCLVETLDRCFQWLCVWLSCRVFRYRCLESVQTLLTAKLAMPQVLSECLRIRSHVQPGDGALGGR